MDEKLIEKIVLQSDLQSGAYSAGQLAEIRDANLVAIMRAMKGQGWGVGKHLNQYQAEDT